MRGALRHEFVSEVCDVEDSAADECVDDSEDHDDEVLGFLFEEE